MDYVPLNSLPRGFLEFSLTNTPAPSTTLTKPAPDNSPSPPRSSLTPLFLENWSPGRRGFVSRGLPLSENWAGVPRSGPGRSGLEDELHQTRPAHSVLLPGRQEEHAQTERFCLLSSPARGQTFLFSEVEQSSYEDDLQILRVIEAYCFSKQRQTMTNSGEALGLKLTRLTLNLSHNNPWFPFPCSLLYWLVWCVVCSV